MEEAMETMKVAFRLLAEDEELPKLAARFARRMHDALIAEGFTSDQAVRLVANSKMGGGS